MSTKVTVEIFSDFDKEKMKCSGLRTQIITEEKHDDACVGGWVNGGQKYSYKIKSLEPTATSTSVRKFKFFAGEHCDIPLRSVSYDSDSEATSESTGMLNYPEVTEPFCYKIKLGKLKAKQGTAEQKDEIQSSADIISALGFLTLFAVIMFDSKP